MANVLPDEKRVRVLSALVNGASIRAVERMTGVHQDTVSRFALALGEGCQRLHDRLVRDLKCHFVDFDEQHSWCGKKQKLVNPEKDDVSLIGEQWSWVALDRTTTLTIAWHVGKRTAASADALVADTRSRLAVMPQISTDGLKLYEAPILLWFGYAVPYAQMVKNVREGGGRASAAEKLASPKAPDFLIKREIYGAPDLSKTTTYAIERSNLTNRQWNARLHRRTLAFSKKLPNHRAAIALQYVYRNLCWISRDMRETAAMAAGVSDHVWELEELMIAALAEPEGQRPEVKPLIIPKPERTAREMLSGKGWLQALEGGKGVKRPAAPSPTPAAPAAAAGVPVAPVAKVASSGADVNGQLDLLAWEAPRQKPRPYVQMDLFGIESDREE